MLRQLVSYLYASGLTALHDRDVLPKLDRWVRRLTARGVLWVPDLRRARSWTLTEARSANEVDLLIAQEVGNQEVAHLLRNQLRIRLHKV